MNPSLARISSGPHPRSRPPLRLLFGWLAALVVGLSAAVLVAQAPPSEDDVKAAYLLNFGKFIRLPSAAGRDHFDICVLGTSPTALALDSLATGEQIGGRPVRVRNAKDSVDARSCDLVYYSASGRSRVEPELAELGNSDVLTVSDAPDFLTRGGMIQFVTVARHVRFSVNLDAVRKTHIVLSSELLRVAASVTGKPEGER